MAVSGHRILLVNGDNKEIGAATECRPYNLFARFAVIALTKLSL
jgi:hypothetical protein